MSRCVRSIVLLLLAGAGSSLRAEPEPGKFNSLIKNSPFGQPVQAAESRATEGSQLEFRGVFRDGNEEFFSIYESASRSSLWVGLRETGHNFTVDSYDSGNATVVVKYNNQPVTLSLKRSQVVVQALAPNVPVPAMASNRQPVNVTGTATAPADEAQRMAQVAEEIRRRRALRAQGGPGPQQMASPGNLPRPMPLPAQP